MTTNKDITAYLKTIPERSQSHPQNVHFLPPSAQKLIEGYAAQPGVLLIMSIGSLPNGKQDEHSDIDLVIVYDNEGIPNKSERLTLLENVYGDDITFNTIDAHIWNFGTSDDFIVANQEVCTQFFTLGYMEEKIDLITAGFYNQIGMEHPLASLSGLLKATVHVDKQKVHAHLCKKIDPYPEGLRKLILEEELDMRLPYYLGRLRVAMARTDMPFADKMIHQAVESAIYILFAHHRQFPNGPKRLFEQLDGLAGNAISQPFKACFSRLLELPSTSHNLHEKYAQVEKMYLLLKESIRA